MRLLCTSDLQGPSADRQLNALRERSPSCRGHDDRARTRRSRLCATCLAWESSGQCRSGCGTAGGVAHERWTEPTSARRKDKSLRSVTHFDRAMTATRRLGVFSHEPRYYGFVIFSLHLHGISSLQPCLWPHQSITRAREHGASKCSSSAAGSGSANWLRSNWRDLCTIDTGDGSNTRFTINSTSNT